MKNLQKKQNKKSKKPVNINISFNINSKNITKHQFTPYQQPTPKPYNSDKTQRVNAMSLPRTPRDLFEVPTTKQDNTFDKGHHQKKPRKVGTQNFSVATTQQLKKRRQNTLPLGKQLYQKITPLDQSILTKKKPISNKKSQRKPHSKSEKILLDNLISKYQKGEFCLKQFKKLLADILLVQSNNNQLSNVSTIKNLERFLHRRNNFSELSHYNQSQSMKKKKVCFSARSDITSHKLDNGITITAPKDSQLTKALLAIKGYRNSEISAQLYKQYNDTVAPSLQQQKIDKFIKTSHSIQLVRQMIQNQRRQFEKVQPERSFKKESIEDIMAKKIQRAWRKYKTYKIIKQWSEIQSQIIPISYAQTLHLTNNIQENQPQELVLSIQNIQKEESQQQEDDTIERINHLRTEKEIQISLDRKSLYEYIQINLADQKKSKRQCLLNLLKIIEIPQPQLSQHFIKHQFKKQQNIPYASNSAQIASFTNKYSSKEVKNINSQSSQYDEFQNFQSNSFDSIHDFKFINFQSMDQALRNRKISINSKRIKQLQLLDKQKEIGKISSEQYKIEKNKIEKWYKSEAQQLKKARKALLKGFQDSKQVLKKQRSSKITQTNEKTKGMIKCLSDNFLLRTAINYKNYVEEKNQSGTFEELSTPILNRVKDVKTQIDGFRVQLDENDSVYNLKFEQISKEFDQVESLQNGSNFDDNLIPYGECTEVTLIKNNHYNKDPQKAIQFISSEEKDDIFEFIFLDLCLQIYLELGRDNKVVKTIDKYIKDLKRFNNIPKGIQTSLSAVRSFLDDLQSYILKNCPQVLINLQHTMGPTAIQMLRYMHENQDEQGSQNDSENQECAPIVLPTEIFDVFVKKFQEELIIPKIFQQPEKQEPRIRFLKSAYHIHNKMIFDCLNQHLDHERPYGIWGKPFPWKKAIKAKSSFTNQEKLKKIKNSIQKSIESASSFCGVLMDKQQNIFGNNYISQLHLQQIREDRLSKMLANELIQNEQRWLFYDDEQTEVLIQISNYLAEKITNEAIIDLLEISSWPDIEVEYL